MAQLDRRLHQLATALSLIGFAGLLAIAALTTVDVVLRWFNWPLRGVNDVISLALTLAIPACLPACFLLKQNISVQILGQWLGPRPNSLFEAFASLLLLVFMGLMVWQFIPYSQNAVNSGLSTWTLAWPVGPWWWGATMLLALSTAVQFAVFVKDVAGIFRPAGSAGGEADHESGLSIT